MKFVNLHSHTGFSLYDAIGSPADHAEQMLKNAGEDAGALAITEHGNMNSIGYIAAAQKKYGDRVKFIYGVEAYYVPSLVEWQTLRQQVQEEKKRKKEEPELVIEDEKESKSKEVNPLNKKHHLVLLAMNQTGLSNLFRLVSRSYREGFYRKPRIDFKMLQEHHEGLVASTACLHPDSLIRTSIGKISIKNIVNKINEGEEIFVLGYDEKCNKICFRKVVWGKLTRKKEKLIKIKTKDGKELKLTTDHKVYTNKGWIEAGKLTKEYKILSFNIPLR